jgi:tetratricopeptide (TPR) repeat protein
MSAAATLTSASLVRLDTDTSFPQVLVGTVLMKRAQRRMSSPGLVIDAHLGTREDAVRMSESTLPASETIGERLRRLRRERGLSQRQVSSPGVSYAYISRIEAGTRQPSVKALRKLAGKLGVSAEYLETGIDLAPREDRELRLAASEVELRLAEDTAKAERELRKLVAEARDAGDTAVAARAQAALGLAALRRGDNRAAIAELELALDSSEFSPATEPEPYGFLGRAYVTVGDAAKAVELFESCLEAVEREAPDNTATRVRFALYLSYTLSDMGDLPRAREIISEALAGAEGLEDAYMRARLHWSQARLAAAAGDPRTALEQLRRAVAILEATEDSRQLGRAHLLWAEILTFEGSAEAAGPHLEIAERLLGAHPDAEDLYWLRTEQARRAAELGDVDDAIGKASQALELMGEEDWAERGAANWALGRALAAKGEWERAEDALRRAVELLSERQVWREAAAASRDLARMLRDLGRTADAVATLEEAAEIAMRIGTPSTGARRRA